MVENARGALFKNDRKSEGSKQPDYSGTIEVTPALLQALLAECGNTGMYKARLAAWRREGPRGTFMSISLEAPYKGGGSSRPPPPSATPRSKGPFDDDIPFD